MWLAPFTPEHSMTTLRFCDGCDKQLPEETTERRELRVALSDDFGKNFDLCRECADIVRETFNPRTWPRRLAADEAGAPGSKLDVRQRPRRLGDRW
jgi:hypothetical protein